MKHKQLIDKVITYQDGRKDFLYGISGLSIYDKINIGKGMYVLVGGQSGSGKTSFVDTVFVINPYLAYKDTDTLPVWVYNSMERDTETKLAKWVCNLLYRETGILLDVPTLLNFPTSKRKLTPQDIKMLDSIGAIYDTLRDRTIITSGSATAEDIRDRKLKIAYQRGKLITANGKHFFVNGKNEGELNATETKNNITRKYFDGKLGRIYENESIYLPSNPNEIVITLDDHIGKIDGPEGANSKKVIDRHATYQGVFKDVCRWLCIDISQFNRDNQSTQRNIRFELDIQEKDFKNSGTPYENADLVLGLINPHKLGHNRYKDINVTKLVAEGGENRLRVLKIVKNSFGSDDIQMPVMFLGENGFISDISSKPDEHEYEHIRNITI